MPVEIPRPATAFSVGQAEAVPATSQVIINHIGYDPGSPSAAVLGLPDGLPPRSVTIREVLADASLGEPRELTAGPVERVARWHIGPFARVPLPVLATGTYVIECVDASGALVSSPAFVVEPDLLQRSVLPDLLSYFRAQRSSGEIDRKDAAAALYGDDSGFTVDARGAWLDASGDFSKFMSHLTYTRMMSPQQIPLCAWAFFAARDEIVRRHPEVADMFTAHLRDEGLFGADFLVRFRSPEGYFYTGIFDALTKDLNERVINAPLPESVRTDRYQAAYRHGGGLAIAALARASTQDAAGEFDSATYLRAATEGFWHLEEHNTEYLFDGIESVLDDYCALLAAAELVAAGEPSAEPAARARAASLIGRYVTTDGGYLVGDFEGRPFFSAAEAGLPVIALLRFAEALPEGPDAEAARSCAARILLDLMARADAVPNPFGYPRHRVQAVGGEARESFFFPHENETGYWWQGENASVASLSTAASLALSAGIIPAEHTERVARFAADQIAWVLGRNPFDACMVTGRGRNNPFYRVEWPNLLGGVVNGITGGIDDEEDLALLPGNAEEGRTWRWGEQWIPHAGWLTLALAAAR
ncbi:hypothetical protein M2390_001728 [Mycetocola sp. BIGb0189]|uniref:glycoside hydrolase family 9 protein n=1 Tax=Mycetocola sp. BIGb0189 TaxID=2940604 RepID=UPI002166E624|nr:glycoside hydrolase family 9 protein [Mycetocola sp. BIGb0189]MCS4276546.1 hypothetical protein [Mycetocola sp. BIGb0189]